MAWKRTISALVVTILFCSASSAQQSRQTPDLRDKIRVESDLVVLSVTVKDSRDKLVSGLLMEDFQVFDDDVEQKIVSFTDESLPLSLLILVDNDMKWKEGTQMARSLRSIIGDIADADEAMICRYDMLFYPGDEFTSDAIHLMAALKAAQSVTQPSAQYVPQPLITDTGSTTGPPPLSAPTYTGSRPSKALDDALYSAAQLLQQRPIDRRRMILIITDGLNEQKLNHHSHAAVLDLLLQNNVSVYSLATGSEKSKRKFSNVADYSSKSGGEIFYTTTTYTMEILYSRMTEQARHDYTLVYVPSNNSKASTFHNLRVTTSPGYTATTRSGYFNTVPDTPN